MYNSFYGFSDRPFALNPDPRFFFRSSVHGRALAYLRYGLEQGEGFVVITGQPGMGKTLLMRTLVADSKVPRLETVEIVTSLLDGDDILQLLTATLNLPVHGLSKGELLAQLRVFLMSRARAGIRILVLIDEAHNLSLRAFEELRMLSNIQLKESAPLQCFLLGQDSLSETLSRSEMVQFQQRVIASCHLHPFEPAECRQYIEFRLKRVAWRGTPELTDGSFRLIHHYTGGVPRRINTFCDRLLLLGSIEQRKVIDEHAVLATVRELAEESSQYSVLDMENELDHPANSSPALSEAGAEGIDVRDSVIGAGSNFAIEEVPLVSEVVRLPEEEFNDSPANVKPPLSPDVVPSEEAAKKPEKKRLVIVDESVLEFEPESRPDPDDMLDARLEDSAHATGRMFQRLWWPARNHNTLITVAISAVVVSILAAGGYGWTRQDNPAPTVPVLPQTSALPDIQTTTAAASDMLITGATPDADASATVAADDGPPLVDVNEDALASVSPYVAVEAPKPVVRETVAQHVEAPKASPKINAEVPVKHERKVSPVDRVVHVTSSETPDHTVAVNSAPAQPPPHSTESVSGVHDSAGSALAAVALPSPPMPDVSFVLPINKNVPSVQPAASIESPATLPASEPGRTSLRSSGDVLTPPPKKPAPVEPAVATEPPIHSELGTLLSQFEAAYRTGNVPQLSRLFAADARTTDASGRRAISQLYRRLFDVTDSRQIGIDHMQWDVASDQAKGTGHFVVTVVEKGEAAPRSYSGLISFVLKPGTDGMVISQLYHEYANH